MFELDLPSLEKNMTNGKGKIEHSTGNKILLFPFPGNDQKIKDLQGDLATFKGIAGACFRDAMNQNQNFQFDKESFIREICSTAQAPNNAFLRDIIENLAFDERGQLIAFNARIFSYLDHYEKNKTLNDISKYIVSLFFGEEEIGELKALAEKEPNNLIHRLILSCLPELEVAKPKGEPYYKAFSTTRLKFKKDFLTLIRDHDLFTDGFQKLLKIYFFQYITELIFQLNSFFEEKKDRYFFSLSWEKLPASRLASINGWQLFEKHINDMYPHANTLELLNHIQGFGDTKVTYQELKELLLTLGPDERNNLKAQIEELTKFYADRVTNGNNPFDWEKFPINDRYPQEPIFNSVYKLWYMVKLQFLETKRERIYLAYRRWFLEFTKLNFTRRRGRNGYSLSLDQESILFLTRLCIGPSEEKIRLSKLWQELEERGFLFDQISKATIVEYFEKVNLLEKKSDSGDAQYVRKLR